MPNDLPELPKRLKKREADVTPRILAWFKAHHPSSCAIEIKATDTNSIPRSALLPHQEAALKAAQSKGGLIHKIADASHLRLPFDAFFLRETEAYVVAAFTTSKEAFVIPVNEWNGASATMRNHFRWKIPLTSARARGKVAQKYSFN